MAAQPLTGSPWRPALAGLLSLATAMGVGRFVYTPILPVMAEALRLAPSQVGLIATVNFAGYLIGALLTALPVFSRSPRPWMLAGLYASAATTAAMGAAGAMPAFLAVRFVSGLASAFVMVFSSTVVLGRLSAHGRSGLSAVHFAGVGIGIAFSAVAVWAMTHAGLDWRGLWIGNGVASALAAAAVTLLVPAAPDPPAAAKAPASAGSGRKSLNTLIFSFGLVGFGYVITATFLVAIVRSLPQARAAEPLVWLVVGLTAAPSVMAWNAVARRIGALPAFALGCLVEAIGVAVSVLAPNVAGALVSAALLGGTFVGLTALALSAANGAGVKPQRTLALMTASFGLGQIIGPMFAGALAERTGDFTGATLAAAAALMLAAGLCALAGRRSIRAAKAFD